MRPSLRLLNLEVSSLRGSKTRYVCSVCRQEARPRPYIARQFLRNASDATTPMTERVRRKIWGTDNPPGLKDPYGGEGVFEKKFKRNQSPRQEGERQEQEGAVEAAEAETTSEDIAAEDTTYEPATTWEGLPRVGHLGKWNDLPSVEVDAYNSFSLNRRLTKQGQLSLAAHQAAVEICLMHTLKKPFAAICDVVEHEKPVFKLIWKCKIQSPAGQWDSAVVYPDKETEEALVYIFEQIGSQQLETDTPEEAAKVAEEIEDTQFEEPIQGTRNSPFFGYQDVQDKGFLSLLLSDPATKFAFLKRFSQLSGHYFPDPLIRSISSVKQVVDYVQTTLTPKPKKLGEYLATDENLQNLPNVKIYTAKQNASHRDEELGRKKVIDAELRQRGLIN